MCLEYSTLTYENPEEDTDTSKRIDDEQNDNAVFGGEIAEEQEFPHMVNFYYLLRGYVQFEINVMYVYIIRRYWVIISKVAMKCFGYAEVQ